MNWLNRIRPKSLAGSKTEKNKSVPEGLENALAPVAIVSSRA